MSTFQTGQWVRRGRNIVILLNSPHPSHAVEAESWAHEDESESGLHDTAWVQRSLNQVMGSGLVVDGIAGSRTRAAVMAFQRSQGLTVDGIAGPNTQAALERRLGTPYVAPPAPSAPSTGPVGTFDGVRVASWLIPYLSWARANGWTGRLNSGWRDPEHSERLCWEMCGAPKCPGKCAGRDSNHSGSVKPKGAVDVSDHVRFGQLMARAPFTPRIFNNLPKDRIHFSATGG